MERYDFDLKEAVENKMIDAKETLEIALEVVELVEEMKKWSHVHRDLEPQNILIKKKNRKWEIKLTDFALAASNYTINIQQRSMSGTPGFAPVTLDYAAQGADDHSLAVTLGSVLFETKSFWNGFFKSQENDGYKKKLSNHPNNYYTLVAQLIDNLFDGKVSHS